MKKLFGYFIVLSTTMWGQQAVSPTINQTPTRQFGHPSLAFPQTQASPNLVEGRELNAPGQIAFDNSVSPPILYVADIGNNRVLGFKSIAKLSAGNFADLVIGQQDMFSTLSSGPGSSLTTGLSSPTGVAVDSKGNLYVADTGNNRIMRFPAPFSQPPGSPPTPDLVIGQKGFNTGSSPNEGSVCSSKTVAFASGGAAFITSLAIDSSGNLWTTDPGNNRVLMYPVANLGAGAVEPVATVVLGQNDFVTNTGPASGNNTQIYKGSLVAPASLAFDASGNLYVADSYSRVLYFQGPNFAAQGQTALRVLGIPPPVTAGPATVYPTQYTLGFPNANGNLISPNGVFTLGNNVFVADTPAHRIVEYDVPSKWAAESTAFPSPPALAVYGQVGFSTGVANKGQAQPDQFSLSSPYAGAVAPGNQMWIADTGNNRVLAFSPTSTGYSGASIVVGQLDYFYSAPNLIEGKEVFLSGGSLHASSMVIDKNSNPPHLYVADPGNNRILCFNDARKVGQVAGTPADRVIGQPDFKTSEINYPLGLPLSPTQTGLHTPIGVAVDNNGNLYVADSGNGRVLRFPAPFSQPAGAQQTANLVLGQSGFTTFIQNASANSMHSPWGIALFAGSDVNATPLAGGLAVSDPTYNRVLLFKKPANGDFTNGQSAYLVIGQSSFSAFAAGSNSSSFNTPLGIAADTSDRLYVADALNNRVMVFSQAPQQISSGQTSSNTIPNISQPQGVAINTVTTELWVTNTGGFQVLRFPEFTTCQVFGCAPTATLSATAQPLGLALDAAGNVIVGDTANRITFYFAQAFFRNLANSNIEALVPGMLAGLGRYGLAMVINDGAATTLPWQTTFSDLNVTVNGTLAPIFATLGNYGAIYFQVPQNAPTSGPATVIATQFSTGAVLAVGTFQTNTANPGFFTASADGLGPVVARLLDGTPVTAASGVPRGSDFYVCLTGEGLVAGAPPDGQAPTAAASTPIAPILYVQGVPAKLSYSGVGCGFPGGWQINATMPMEAIPGANSIILTYNDIPSNIGGTSATTGLGPGADRKIATTIYAK